MTKIIVVDDDHSTSRLVKMLLEMEGFTVLPVADAQQALEAAEHDVSAFIIDCYLSADESGIDLLRAIRQRQLDVRADIPVIMVSGDQRLEEEVIEAGADLFMLKPYLPGDLTKGVRELLNSDE
jgi:two-component system response regulator CpxR